MNENTQYETVQGYAVRKNARNTNHNNKENNVSDNKTKKPAKSASASARNTNHNKENKLNTSFARPTVIKTEVFDNVEVPDYAICSCQYVSFFNDGSQRSGVSYFGPQVLCDDCGLEVHDEAVTRKYVSRNFGLNINDARIKPSREFQHAERVLGDAEIFSAKTLARVEFARASVDAHYKALKESLEETLNCADFSSELYKLEEVIARVNLALPVAIAWLDACQHKNEIAHANRKLAKYQYKTAGFTSTDDPAFARLLDANTQAEKHYHDAERVYKSALKHHNKTAPVKFNHNTLLVDTDYNVKGEV